MHSRRNFLTSASAFALAPGLLAIHATAQTPDVSPAADGDIIFADFESGNYDGWTLTGDCWGDTPASDQTFSGAIKGFAGKRFLCSFHPKRGGAATGRAISKSFVIARPYITFLVGGGYLPGEVCIDLVVDGKIACTATGNDRRVLVPAMWDVAGLTGKTAHIEVVDSSTTADLGYILVDAITFSDRPTGQRIRDLEDARKQVDQNTHEPISELDQQLVQQFQKWGKALGLSDEVLRNPRIATNGTWICVVNERSGDHDYVYSLDCSGNATFRRISNLPILANAITTGRKGSADVDTIRRAKEIARSLGFGESSDSQSYRKQEHLIYGKCDKPVSKVRGRSLVRIVPTNTRGCIEVMFDGEGHPCNIEATIRVPELMKLADLIFEAGRRSKLGYELVDNAPLMAIGSFYGVNEQRLKEAAQAFAGLDVLTPQMSRSNPYDRDSQHILWRSFDLWEGSGRIGGLRGNYSAGRWQKSGVSVDCIPLSSIRLVGDNSRRGTFRVLGDEFYRTTEQRFTAAIFSTHGGPIYGVFQLGSGVGPDTWFAIGSSDHKFGTGKLRHLFFQGCGALTHFADNDPENRVLDREWMTAHTVNGLRTVCGYDGVGPCEMSCGTLFSEAYNKGYPISLAWLYATSTLTNAHGMNPATISYGASIEDAIATLADGRFSTVRAGAEYCAASIWTDS